MAMRAPRAPSPDRDQIQYLRDQLAHREVQLEHVRSERAIHVVQKKLLAQMRLLSSETKIGNPEWSVMQNTWICKNITQDHGNTTNHGQTVSGRWREVEAQRRDMHGSNSTQVQQLAANLQTRDACN